MTTRVEVDVSSASIEALQIADNPLWLHYEDEGSRWRYVTGPALSTENEDVEIATEDGDVFSGCYVYEVEDGPFGAFKIGVC